MPTSGSETSRDHPPRRPGQCHGSRETRGVSEPRSANGIRSPALKTSGGSPESRLQGWRGRIYHRLKPVPARSIQCDPRFFTTRDGGPCQPLMSSAPSARQAHSLCTTTRTYHVPASRLGSSELKVPDLLI